MSNPSEMQDRAVAIAEENGFEYVDLYLYQPKDNESAFGLWIEPYLNNGVSIQVKDLFIPMEASEPIILTPLDNALLKPIIKAFAFANLAVVRALEEA